MDATAMMDATTRTDAALDGQSDSRLPDSSQTEDARPVDAALDGAPDAQQTDAQQTDAQQTPLGEWTSTFLPIGSGGSYFGERVAISGDGTRIVAAGRDAGSDGNGLVLVYDFIDGRWTSGTALQRPANVTRFGAEIAISADGTRIAVGDLTFNGGGHASPVLVYSWSPAGWGAPVSLPHPSSPGRFGFSLGLSQNGNRLAAGLVQSGSGAVQLYDFQNGRWQISEIISPPAGAAAFAWSLALSANGNVLAVGDTAAGPQGRGAAHVFRRATNGAWDSGTAVQAPAAIYVFGTSIALSDNGDRLLVGDVGRRPPFQNPSQAIAASVHAYAFTSNHWSSGLSLPPPSGAREFGYHIALSGDGELAVVGDHDGQSSASDPTGGAVSLYQLAGGAPSFDDDLPKDPQNLWRNGNHGVDVDISRDARRVVVGESGAVTVYSR